MRHLKSYGRVDDIPSGFTWLGVRDVTQGSMRLASGTLAYGFGEMIKFVQDKRPCTVDRPRAQGTLAIPGIQYSYLRWADYHLNC